MGLQTALYVVIGVLTALCLMFMLIGFTVVIMTLAIRPWDGDIRRDYSWAAATPYSGFLLSTWIVRIAYYVNALKPAPLRAMELATAFILSQALFMLVNLGIPDLLLSGPRSADDLAANIGPAVHPDRLARVLDFAAAFNLVNRKKVRCRSHKRRQEPATAASSAASTSAAAAPATVENGEVSSSGSAEAGKKNVSRDVDAPASSDALADLKVGLLEAHGSKTVLAMDNHAADTAVASSSGNDRPQTIYVYSLSAVSACLTSESPVCVADMVKLMEDNYARYQFFSEAMKTGTIPFELWSGGKDFWQHILSSPRHAKTFDHAMVQINQLGGPAVAAQYAFDKFELIVDVAGGVGGFLCDVLKRHKGPKGIVFDQPAQIERAQKLWAQDLPYRPLAARVELVAGDMFDAETIPAPPQVNGKVAYILRNILHDWVYHDWASQIQASHLGMHRRVDADCLRILRSLRRRIADTDKSRVRLLIIEPTSMETPCKNIYPHRLMSDMIMLAAFGDAKERNKQQFETLLDATGWRLRKIKPTTGVFLVLEAVPV